MDDEAISNSLIYIEARSLPRNFGYARNDRRNISIIDIRDKSRE